ncbi:MAG: MBL fold metallo-hydrolase, partial [Candidatus Cloacimonadaceae bacterium]
MFQTAVLASGSKGNCVLVASDETALLIDAGISAKRVWSVFDHLNFDKNKLQGILISHEHGDHISGAGAVSRILKIPIYLTRDTYQACRHRLGNLYDRIFFIRAGESFAIGDGADHQRRRWTRRAPHPGAARSLHHPRGAGH